MPVAAPDRTPAADPVCVAAVDLAWKAALDEMGPEAVGGHLGETAPADRVVLHRFTCTLPGYVGWEWHVIVSRAKRTRTVTVSEVQLAPTEVSIQPQPWVPWNERVRPGDLSAGAVAPSAPDDERLSPGWSGDDDLASDLHAGPLHPVNWEPGLGRKQVPSRAGRIEAADRWSTGPTGPNNASTRSAPGTCSTCGWMLTIGGPLGQAFGACTNDLSPSDGHIVSFDHGCGGHSEAKVESSAPVVPTVLDEFAMQELDTGNPEAGA